MALFHSHAIIRALAVASLGASMMGAGPVGAAAAQDMVPDAPVETRASLPPPRAAIAESGRPVAPAPAAFFVRVTGGGKELWSGDLLVEANQGAELRLTLQQGDSNCGGRDSWRYSRRQTGLTFSLRHAGRREGDTGFTLSAEWTRSSSDCALPGTRTAGIETAVTVEPGAVAVIEADGGLRIELTRRK